METVNLFGAQRGRAAQAAAWAMEKERFSTQEMANALAVSTPTAITLLRRLEGHGLVQPCGEFSSTGGRKPRAWSACPGARYVVGADITLRHVSLVAVDLSDDAVTLTVSDQITYYDEVTETVSYETVRRANPDLPKGTEKVVQQGKDGVRTAIYEVVWSEGQQVSRQFV